MRRAAWAGAAALSAALLVVLALHGRRPDPGLDRFEAAGLMLDILPERVAAVEVLRGGRTWRFERPDGAWRPVAGSPPTAADAGERLEAGLRFLHVSPPQRVLGPEETRDGEEDYGLDPPRYTVLVRVADGPAFALAFGAANPQGLSQYARVPGRTEIVLLPRFVGEPWEALTAAP